jgi:hypothetical protein
MNHGAACAMLIVYYRDVHDSKLTYAGGFKILSTVCIVCCMLYSTRSTSLHDTSPIISYY